MLLTFYAIIITWCIIILTFYVSYDLVMTIINFYLIILTYFLLFVLTIGILNHMIMTFCHNFEWPKLVLFFGERNGLYV